jgi:beta-lactamase superfamily II metal-dependent hydrolase
MLIEVFDVDHGFCALVTADDGRQVLLDCGHSSVTGLRPSSILTSRGVRALDALIVSHADEDHVSDLPELLKTVLIRSVIANDSLKSGTLCRIKAVAGEAGPGAEALIGRMIWSKFPWWVALVGGDIHPRLPEAEILFYRNQYPLFDDLNNLSLVTFLHYGDIHAVFPGDLEVSGWRSLLRDPGFCVELARVNVFVASHHGRQNGFCAEVFRFCRPEIVVISDSPLQYASQEMTAHYADQALGVTFGSERRRVLTTRCDGTIRIYQSLAANTGAWVNTDKSLSKAVRRLPGFRRLYRGRH